MNGSSTIEEGKKYVFVKPNEEVNGTGKISLDRRSLKYCENGSSSKNTWCYKNERGKQINNRTSFYLGISVVLIFLLLSVVIPLILLAVRINKTCPVSPSAALDVPCPKGWIGYQRKCYYFSETEGNWTFGSRHCSSHSASLAVVDSQEEMEFLFRYKSPPDHWIGLQKDSGQPCRWINGSIFTEQLFGLPTEEGIRCAYLNHKRIGSSGCTREEPWVCSREITGH